HHIPTRTLTVASARLTARDNLGIAARARSRPRKLILSIASSHRAPKRSTTLEGWSRLSRVRGREGAGPCVGRWFMDRAPSLSQRPTGIGTSAPPRRHQPGANRVVHVGANVRFGSLADISQCNRHVCFTPESGHSPDGFSRVSHLENGQWLAQGGRVGVSMLPRADPEADDRLLAQCLCGLQSMYTLD